MKKIGLLVGMLLLSISIVFAAEDFSETKKLIDSNISCDKLTDDQLEEMGDYYMEQMHPGEQHEMMDRMMGGEDSETVKQMHIQMAKSIYCGETNQGMVSMMNMMTNGMMGSGGMMGMMNYGSNGFGNMMTNKVGGMMGNYGSYGMMGGYGMNNSWSFLYILLLIGLIILVYVLIIKLIRELLKGNKKRG